MQYIVEGSVRSDESRTRVTARLTRVTDEVNLWAESYDESANEPLATQIEIAERIAASLDIVLNEDSLAAMRIAGVDDPEAYLHYRDGMDIFARAHGNFADLSPLAIANVHFEKAIELAPNFVEAYVRHADYYTHFFDELAVSGEIPADPSLVASKRAEYVEDLDATIRYARTDKLRRDAIYQKAFLTGEWRGLADMIDDILADPTCVINSWILPMSVPFHRAEESVESFSKNIACDPLNYGSRVALTVALIGAGRAEEAVTATLAGLEVVQSERQDWALAMALLSAGDLMQVQDMVDSGFRSDEFVRFHKVALAALSGDENVARQALADYRSRHGTTTRDVLIFEAWAGQREEANRVAARLDGRPFGYMPLTLAAQFCFCGAPFDLAYTPNFAQKLESAGLPWPPQQTIDWPLKAW